LIRLRCWALNALRRRAQVLNVCKVAQPSRCKFRGDEIFSRNKQRLKAGRAVKDSFNPASPSRIEIDAGNVGKNVEALRIISETEKSASVCEVFWVNVLQRCTKLRERGIRRFRVG
jgi:hypothetical protein